MTEDHECRPSLRELLEQQIDALERLMESQRKADLMAVEKALSASKELAEKHNDLIRQMEQRDNTYVSEEVYRERHIALEARLARMEVLGARMVGGMLALAAVGIANLVKIFGG